MNDQLAPRDPVLTSTVLLFLGVTYLSWLTWLASSVGGGVFVYAIYLLPMALATISSRGSARIFVGHARRAPSSLTIGGIAFVIIYVITNQVVAESDLTRTVLGARIDVGVLNLIAIIAAVSLGVVLLKTPERFATLVTRSVVACLLVDAVLTYIAVQSDPMASKLLATMDGTASLGYTGASGFYIVNAAALLVPAILCRAGGTGKSPWLFALLVTGLFIYFCGYLLAMVAAIIAIVAYAFFMTSRHTRLWTLTLCLPIAAGIGTSSLAPALRWLSDRIPFYEVSRRLSDLASFVTVGATDPSLYRFTLYQDTWNGFLSSPIAGVLIQNPNFPLSRHSTVLDVLASTGLIGFTCLISAALGAYRMSVRLLSSTEQVAGLRASYATLAFISLVNPIFNQPAIVFTVVAVVPLICYGWRKVPEPSPRKGNDATRSGPDGLRARIGER